MDQKVPGYVGVQARMFARRKVKPESEMQTFKVLFKRTDGEIFDDYIIEAKSDHVAWALGHMKFEADYPHEDAESYCIEVVRHEID